MTNGTPTASIASVGNGWFRCAWTATATATTSPNFFVYIDNGTTISYTGNGYSGIYIWGAQLEAGAFPTSYIPTVASQVTRSADAASMTGANFSSWYNQAEGTVYTEASSFSAPNLDNMALSLPNGTDNTRGLLVNFRDTTLQVRVRGSGDEVTFENYTIVSGSYAKVALAHQGNIGASSANGAVATQKTITPLIPAELLTIGARGTTNPLNGHIRKLSYYPKALTAAELQALTEV